jgi:hypothetical protein
VLVVLEILKVQTVYLAQLQVQAVDVAAALLVALFRLHPVVVAVELFKRVRGLQLLLRLLVVAVLVLLVKARMAVQMAAVKLVMLAKVMLVVE